MSDAAKSQDDLSIEEILGSIRRIIAEDDDENMPQQAGAKTGETETVLAEPQPEPSQAEPPQDDSGFSDMEDDEEEPLILTNRIESENEQHISLEENEQDAASVLIHDDMADIPEEEQIISGSAQEEFVQEEPVQEKSNEPTARTETAIPADSPVKEDISTMTNSQDDATLDATLKDNALLSSNAAIATAAVMAKLARQAAITEEGNGNVTIEAMVKEMIRPMLREWLDANLPDLVQKMVERELERLTKRL